jgi:hypothetical protein
MDDKDKVKSLLENSFRQYGYTFTKLDLGYFVVSAQGSSTHNCFPKKDLQKLNNYSQLEIAIFDIYNNWLDPNNHELMKDLEWAKLFKNAGASNPTADFISLAMIEQIILDLLVLSRKHMN